VLGAPVTLVGGVATLTVPASTFPAAHYHVVATYSGDSNYAAGQTTLVQPVLETAATSLSASTASSPFGGSVTFTATVTPNGTSFVPIGTVTFMNGNTVLGTASLNNLDGATNPPSSNQATFTTSSLPASVDAITAVYSGDLNFAGSTSPILDESVGATTTTLTDNGPNPSNYNDSVSFTATVSGGSAISGQTVFIEDASNGNAVVASPTLTGGTVTFTISTLTVGTYNLFAVYIGDTSHAGSNSSLTPVTQVVNAIAAAPAVSSVVVNGGAPAYLDSNGLAVSLAGQNSVVEQILVTFNEAVTLDPAAFTITNNAAGVTVIGGPAPNTLAVNAIQTPVGSSPSAQWIVTFSGPGTNPIPGGLGNVIKDGLYILNVAGSKVHANGQTAANVSTGFWALFGSAYAPDNTVSGTIGDGNSEVVVDSPDFNLFKQAFGSESDLPGSASQPYYNVSMDSNLDGLVDATDFLNFKNNFGADWVF
jgi:hypothetical protein